MPAAPGKLATVLLVMEPVVTLDEVVDDPSNVSFIAEPFEVPVPPVVVPLVSVLPLMERLEIVPLWFRMSMPSQVALFRTLLLMFTVPETFRSVPVTNVSKRMSESSGNEFVLSGKWPTLLIVPLLKVKFVTVVARPPLPLSEPRLAP